MKKIVHRIKDVWHILTSRSYILIYHSKTGLELAADTDNIVFDALVNRLAKFIPNWFAQTYGKQDKQKKESTDEAD